jgi:hypothetical protein
LGDQHGEALPEHLRLGVAEDLLGGAVDELYPAVLVDHYYGV